jgi:hypothetical protein
MPHIIRFAHFSVILVGCGIESVRESGVLVEAVERAVPASEAWTMASIIATPEMHGDEAREGGVQGVEEFGGSGL